MTERMPRDGYFRSMVTWIRMCAKGTPLFTHLSWLLLAVAPHGVDAQQSLNLDFEKKSIEHPQRPWGWDGMASEALAFSLDSNTVHSGEYSFRMEGLSEETPDVQSVTFSLEPYAFARKKAVINGMVKTNGLEGTVYVSVHGPDEDASPLAISQKIPGTADWQEVSLPFYIADSIAAIHLSLNLMGKGMAWFDGFQLMLNDKEYTALEIAPPFTEQQQQWVNEASTPLRSVDATSGTGTFKPAPDLEAFKSLVGSARLIALGESTHGSSEFFRLKHRLLEYAVHVLNVNAFALEGNMLTVENINNYVLSGQGSAKESMHGIFGVWYTQEVLDMVTWVRNYNIDHPKDPVQFVGYDIQEVIPAVDSLRRFLAQHDPELLASAEALLTDLHDHGGWGVAAAASEEQRLTWFEDAAGLLAMVKSRENTWLEQAAGKSSRSDIAWGVQYANLIKQFAENTYKGHYSFYRDKAMAENITWFLANQSQDSRMLLWAHDYHISRGDHATNDFNIYDGLSMGHYLSKQHGDDYKAFGISTYEGSYRGMVSYWNFKSVTCPLYPSPKGTLDEAMHQAAVEKKAPGIILDLQGARSEDWLAKPLRSRFANHVNIEYGYWTAYAIPYQFDAILFVDQTSASTPLR